MHKNYLGNIKTKQNTAHMPKSPFTLVSYLVRVMLCYLTVIVHDLMIFIVLIHTSKFMDL